MKRTVIVVSCIMFVAATALLSGCGYTTRAYVGPHRSIYVAPFENNINIASHKSDYSNYISYYPLLESTITRAVVDRFIFDGSLAIRSQEQADLTLRGQLIEYRRDELRYASNNEDVTEYRVNIFVNLQLYDNKKGTLMWKRDNFTGYATYFVSGSQATTEKAALDEAVEDLARRIVEEVVEAW